MVMESSPSPQCVGREFVRQYYTLLNEAPHFLHRFYSNSSSFIHGGDAKPGEEEQLPIIGQTDIHKKIMSLNFKDCHAKIRYVDSQSTIGTGVVVQVTGELSNNQAPLRRFMQTFVLAPQTSNSYFVNNDIFRYQDEVFTESDEEDESTEDINEISGKCSPDELAQMESVSNELSIYEQQQLAAERELHAHQQINDAAAAAMGMTKEHVEHAVPNGHQEMQQEVTVSPPPPTAPVEEPMTAEPEISAPEESVEAPTEPICAQVDVHAQQVIEDPNAAGEPPKPRSWANIAHVSGSGASAPAVAPMPITQQPSNYHTQLTADQEERKPVPSAQRGNHHPMRNNRPSSTLPAEQRGFGDSTAAAGKGFRIEDGAGMEERRPERAKFPDCQQVFVGNLPTHISDFELRDIFKGHGAVLEVRVNRSSSGKIPFGFVVFDSEVAAQKVLQLKSVEFNGHRLNIEEKKARSDGNTRHNARQQHARPRHTRGNMGPRGGGGGFPGQSREHSGSRTDQGRFNNLNKSNAHRR